MISHFISNCLTMTLAFFKKAVFCFRLKPDGAIFCPVVTGGGGFQHQADHLWD
jgi:hypothetical protein